MKILITGASSGIGKAVLKLCLQKHFQVLGIARDFSKCDIQDANFSKVEMDLSDFNELDQKIKSHILPLAPFDAAIFSAGQGLFGALEQFSYDQIQTLMQLNFLSSVMLTKALLPQMKKNEQGTLIFIGSEAALQGKTQGSVYCASKFALRGFSQALRKECAKSGIRVSLINPGMVKTPFFNSLHFSHAEHENYYVTAEEVAEVIMGQLCARPSLVFDEVNFSPLKHQLVSKVKN